MLHCTAFAPYPYVTSIKSVATGGHLPIYERNFDRLVPPDSEENKRNEEKRMGNDCSCSSGVVEPELGTLGTDLQLCGPIMSLHTIKVSKVTKSPFFKPGLCFKEFIKYQTILTFERLLGNRH